MGEEIIPHNIFVDLMRTVNVSAVVVEFISLV